MAAPLEFKRRVRLPEPLGEERPAKRRSFALPVGALSWLAIVGLAVAISEGVVPIDRWLHVEAPPVMAALAAPTTRPAAPAAPLPELPVARAPAPELPPDIEEPALAVSDDPAPQIDEEPPGAVPTPPADESEPSEPAAAAPPPIAEPEPAAREAEAKTEPKPKAEAVSSVAAAGKSCEQAAAEAVQSIEMGKSSGPADLGRHDYSAVLDRGTYFEHCGAPETVRIDICAAVQNGRAVGVTVRTTPGMSSVSACIARAVRGLSFPRHPRLDVVRTTFEAD